ncbi:MAG: hypothetical protein GX147_01840 [Deltaproteobacteria bacterium]|nr:hypothetical protein [Deltaproteobacteria bacterium]
MLKIGKIFLSVFFLFGLSIFINDLSAKDLPDLVVDKFEVVQIAPGEASTDGVTYPTRHLSFVWTVSNRGTAVSNQTTLNVSCSMEKGGITGSCPAGLTNNYYIGGLWPRPGDITGTQVVWNSPSIEAPEKGVKYRFSAQVNPNRSFEEVTYSNNSLSSQYTEGISLRYVPSEKFRQMATLEKKVKRGPISGFAPPGPQNTQVQASALPGPQNTQVQASTPPKVVPEISVQSIMTQPPRLKENAPFNFTIRFINKGRITQEPGMQYSLECRVISGGPACPFPVGTKTIDRGIPPRRTRIVTYSGITGPAGTYEIKVKILPEKPGSTPFTTLQRIWPKEYRDSTK